MPECELHTHIIHVLSSSDSSQLYTCTTIRPDTGSIYFNTRPRKQLDERIIIATVVETVNCMVVNKHNSADRFSNFTPRQLLVLLSLP